MRTRTAIKLVGNNCYISLEFGLTRACLAVPVPTYILGPTKSGQLETDYKETENGEICTNITYLGKRGLYTASSGVKIAYLSGVEGSSSSDIHFDMSDAEQVRNACLSSNIASDFRGVDILMTSQWPKGIEKTEDESGSTLISWLSTQIRPRYHFCGRNGKHHERLPFRVPANDCTELQLSTRFISLAELGSKSKNIYALVVTPVDKMKLIDLIQKTTDETESPYQHMDFSSFVPKRLNPESNQFFYDMNSFGGDRRKRPHGDQQGQQNKRRPRPEFDQEKCWFCLSSPSVEKHLVISIGENFYLALAKGPLNDYHVLILSVTHIQSVSLLSQEDFDELDRFKEALRNLYKSKGKTAAFFERNYKSPHLQVNAVAIDESLEWRMKSTVDDKAEEYNIQLETVPKLMAPTQLPPQGPYFALEMPDYTTFITRQMKQFPLHFGRDIFCAEGLLNCEDKVDWRQCSLDKEQEVETVKRFRAEFKPFDFTL